MHELTWAKERGLPAQSRGPPGGALPGTLHLLFYTIPPLLPLTQHRGCNPLIILLPITNGSGLRFKGDKFFDCLFFGTFNKILVYRLKLPS